jgi:hypothetical protein
MGNSAAIYFKDSGAVDDGSLGGYAVHLHWNGGPESVYAFVKALASYRLSQLRHETFNSGATLDQVDASRMSARFIQLVSNYFNSCSSDFRHIWLEHKPGRPEKCNMEADKGVYVVRSDFSVERYIRYDLKAKKWMKDGDARRIEEFREALNSEYWVGEGQILEGIREANDAICLKRHKRVEPMEFCLAELPIEQELRAKIAAEEGALTLEPLRLESI